jgi:hypothetical protein
VPASTPGCRTADQGVRSLASHGGTFAGCSRYRESWRTALLLTLATLATGAACGLIASAVYDRPEEVTCGKLAMDMSKRTEVADQLAADLDIPGHRVDRVALVVAEELGASCGRHSSSHRPVNSDLKGTVRQRLEARGG